MRSNWAKFARLDQRLKSNLKPIKGDAHAAIMDTSFAGSEFKKFFDQDAGKLDTIDFRPIPKALSDKLMQDCPFWNEQKTKNYKVLQTHYLVWVPTGISSLEELESQLFNRLKKTLQGPKPIEFYWPQELTISKYDCGYWLLMTKDLVPGTRERNRVECAEHLKDEGYSFPNAVDWAVGLYTYYLKNNGKLMEGDAQSVTTENNGRIEKNSFSYLAETGVCGNDIFGSGFAPNSEDGAESIEIGETQPQQKWIIQDYIGACGVMKFDADGNLLGAENGTFAKGYQA